ncbi:DMT family transporter [Streptomyces sp. 8K308]|uniref:DMT family transporter n=1 Tax=Streptomyces sp. 8K308 TaxID=2530388 RepID=UPI001FB5F0D9|nr:DMT family transporter [Streptomyces sp. 8K308]
MTTESPAASAAPTTTPATTVDLPSAAAALVAVVLWASAFVVIRDVTSTISPAPLALLRLAVAAVALTLAVAVRGRRALRRQRWSRGPLLLIGGYGVLWLAAYTVALNAAERHVDAGTSALLVNLAPLLVAVGAAATLRERLSRPLVLGGLVSLSGVAIITAGTGDGQRDGVGVLLCLLAAALYAGGVLLQKPALEHVDPLTAIWLGCLAGTAVLLPWAPRLLDELAAAPGSAVASGVYLGLFPTAIGFWVWSFALRRTDAGRLAASTYAVPAVSVLLSWLVLGESPTALALTGGTVCLLGVAISRRRGAGR